MNPLLSLFGTLKVKYILTTGIVFSSFSVASNAAKRRNDTNRPPQYGGVLWWLDCAISSFRGEMAQTDHHTNENKEGRGQ